MMENWVRIFGPPQKILSDNAGKFINAEIVLNVMSNQKPAKNIHLFHHNYDNRSIIASRAIMIIDQY